MRRQEILKDNAKDVFYDVHVGRPSAATVSITKPGGGDMPTAVEDESATIDTVDTTATAYDSDTPKQITIASVAGIVKGREYLITNSVGQTAFVRVSGIDTSGKVVYLADEMPLGEGLASGDTFQGTRISFELVAANTATCDLNYVVIWDYTVDSVDYQFVDTVDIVRNIPKRIATSDGFRRFNPGLANLFEQAATPNGDWNERLEVAFERVLWDIEQSGEDSRANAFMDMKSLENPTYWAALLALAEGGYKPKTYRDMPAEWLATLERKYSHALGQAVQHIRWFDVDEDLTVDEGEEDVTRRTCRMVR